MHFIVTGAAGFIGSNLCEFLLDIGSDVIGIDNFNDFYNPKIKEYNVKDFVGHTNFSLYRCDILDKKALDQVFRAQKDLGALVHLAAWPGVTRSFDTPGVYVRNNLEATVNLLEMCRKYGVNNFIFASTSSVYGNSPAPFVETMSTDFPLAPYPATKKACEVMLYTYAKAYGINVSVLRIFNPNGKRLRPDLAIPKLVKSCLYGYEFPMYWNNQTAAQSKRDYCYVNHIFDSIVHLAKKPYPYEIFNMGNSSPVSLVQLIETVETVVGKKVKIIQKPPRPGEMNVTYANIEKAKKMAGYNPSTSISQLVEIYYQWFLQQDEWYQKLTEV